MIEKVSNKLLDRHVPVEPKTLLIFARAASSPYGCCYPAVIMHWSITAFLIWFGLSAVCFVIFTALVLIDWQKQKNRKK